MNYSKVKDIYENDNIGLYKLSRDEKRKVLKDTFLWLPGYENRLKEKVDDILSKAEQSKPKNEKQNHGTFELPSEDKDEYIPHDMEFGESLGESPHSFEISPYLSGYYTGGRKSYFDKNRLIWSKRKRLKSFGFGIPDEELKKHKKYNFAGKIGKGIFSIPLPVGAWPITDTLVSNTKGLKFKIDQNNQLYIESKSKGEFSFDFYLDMYKDNQEPINKDSERIINGKLTDETNIILDNLRQDTKTDLEKAKKIEEYINTGKKYNEKVQGEIFKRSNKNNYFENLDIASSLECYSSNTLFVGLLRELGIKSRLVVGHHIQSKGKNEKGNIGQNTGHAWSEVWDEYNSIWIRFDATPLIREQEPKNEGEKQDEIKDEGTGDKDGDKKDNGDQSGKKQGENDNSNKGEGSDKTDEGEDEKGGKQNEKIEEKTAEELLEEIIQKVENDDFNKQEEELNKQLEEVDNVEDKDELKDIKDKSKLTKKAKKILEDEVEKRILEKEKEEIEDIKDEKEIDKRLENSILDDENFKRKLKEYARKLKKKIEEERSRKEVQMKKYGFSKEELALFDEYMKLEREVKNEIKVNIRKLEKLLPKEYKIVEDESRYFSGKQIDKSKLVNYKLTGDPRIFKRNYEEIQDIKVNMFESILIDRSGSMGEFKNSKSPLRNAIKAAIIRARTLEHFKVDFNIVFFDDDIEEIMTFGEKFGSKKTMIPARLMRAAKKSGGTNISAPIIYTKENLSKYSKKIGKKYLGNITFIGDGEPMSGLTGKHLKDLINDTKSKFPVTAFYISGGTQNDTELEKYFGKSESGGTVIIDNVSKLSKGIVDTFNKNIKKTLRRIDRMK